MSAPEPASFGELLSRYRRSAGLTQEELSERSGISVRAISDIERVRAKWPQRRTIESLVTALGLSEGDRAEVLRAVRAGRTGASPARRSRPATWYPPLVLADLTGRDEVLADLVALAGGDGDKVAVLHGAPGVGKTSVAVRAAHLLADRFPDGQVLIGLGGLAGPAEVLTRLLADLGADEADLPGGLPERLALCRSMLADRRVLVILDDVADEAQLGPLPALAGPDRMIVITSRRRLAGLERARRIRLGPLPDAAAIELLASIVGPDRVAAERGAAAELVRRCGRLPLAVRIAGNRLASRPRWPIRYLVEQLRDHHRGLSVLTAGDLRLSGAFDVSYAHLDADSSLMFRRLGLAPGPRVDVELAAVLAGMAPARAREALEELVETSLLDAGADGTYVMPDLLRVFAGELLTPQDHAAGQHALGWLLDAAVAAGLSLLPSGAPRPVPGERESWSEPAARAWLSRYREVLPAVADRAAELGLRHEVVRAALALAGCATPVWRGFFTTALGCARAEHHREAEVVLLTVLGGLHVDREPRQALHLLREAEQVAAESGETGYLGWTSLAASAAHSSLGDPEAARECCLRAVELLRGNSFGRHIAQSDLGVLLETAGQPAQAVELHRAVVAHFRQAESQRTGVDAVLLARLLVRLGVALVSAGEAGEAVEVFTEAVARQRAAGGAVGEAVASRLRAEALRRLG